MSESSGDPRIEMGEGVAGVSLRTEFTPVRPVTAEGARCGVATCLVCGAAVWLDPSDSVSALQLHRDWHRTLRSE
jgi:hypothetical protein